MASPGSHATRGHNVSPSGPVLVIGNPRTNATRVAGGRRFRRHAENAPPTDDLFADAKPDSDGPRNESQGKETLFYEMDQIL